jgi:hypothetical protein
MYSTTPILGGLRPIPSKLIAIIVPSLLEIKRLSISSWPVTLEW